MKKLFLNITHYGIKAETPADIKEQIKLVNGISVLGVPICLTYILLFLMTGYYDLVVAFALGVLVFSLPPFLIKMFGLNTGRYFISVMASVFFGSVSVMTGKDTGFYLGFLVISVPPMIIFPKVKSALVFTAISMLCLILSIAGNVLFPPTYVIPFAMGIYLLNLFTVFMATVSVVFIFKTELSDSREKLTEKNKEITDSINYAKRIQYTLLAHDQFLSKYLPGHFVLFKPKDIVSGDFYWATERENKFYLAVCDSTGHGVPGAFMSLLNIGFLSEAINEKDIYEPHKVLNHVRNRLIDSISKDGGKDGMDAILMSLEFRDKSSEKGQDSTQNSHLSTLNSQLSTITYAGANNHPILIRDNRIIELAKDKMPVGKGEHLNSFTLHSIETKPGDMLYLYTDGYADQFGGPKGKKFKYKQLNELLLSISKEPMDKQQQKLNTVFEAWKGNLEQVDDVCIIGIKI